MTLNIKLDKYTLIEEIGRGGYGTVYRARDEALQVERAVKVLHPALVADPAFIDRFREEARLVARLKHPHIVPVYDLGEDQGRIYLAMEYLSSGSLKDLLAQEGALPYAHALVVLKQISDALDYAHGLNLVHRDIKPGNILLDAQGNAYLTDFGFAKSLASADSSTTMTMTGGILGTPAYMAPEAWDGKGWTPAADVYSLACVFFEILLGRPLFDGDTPTRLMKQHIIEGPQFPDVWPDGVPAEISPVMGKALAQEIKNRYKTTLSFASALDIQELEPLPVVEPEEPAEEQTAKRVQHTPTKSSPWWQHWGFWAGISAAALLLIFSQSFKSETHDVVVETVLVTAQAQVVGTLT
ncbi:MAG: serine/threonine protein kinase, partial [Anaerolineae bacterium]|nr:serine/threonine protein kinase [Anaerolineae bacterium]